MNSLVGSSARRREGPAGAPGSLLEVSILPLPRCLGALGGRYRGHFSAVLGTFLHLPLLQRAGSTTCSSQHLYLSTSIWLFLNSVLQEHLAASPSMDIFRYFPISN